MTGLLDDLIILDLTRFLSGPQCTLLLAGLGAEVIKVDDPTTGDPIASAPPLIGPEGASFEREPGCDYGLAYLKRARGKRSTTINLKHPRGVELLLSLVEHADVVVENFRPGVSERLGIDYPILRERNPRLIHCAITGYGSSGPDRQLKSYDLMAQAASGLMSITGGEDGPPMKTGGALSDMIAGAYAALAILAALHERSTSDRGQSIDVSMVDCLFSMMMDEPLDCYSELGLSPRQANRIMRMSPFNSYRARDGWVTIGVNSASDWRALTRAMQRDELADDADFSRVEWRIANNARVDSVVAEWVARHDVAQVVAALREHDVAVSPVRSATEAIAWPHLLERGMIRTLQEPDGTPTEAVAAELPLRFSRSSASHDRPAPVPGEHTAQVLQRFLGLTQDAHDELRRQGVV